MKLSKLLFASKFSFFCLFTFFIISCKKNDNNTATPAPSNSPSKFIFKDSLGNTLNSVTFSYDNQNRLTGYQALNKNGTITGTIAITYNSSYNFASQTYKDSAGTIQTTTYTYNSAGYITSAKVNDTLSTKYYYNSDNSIQSEVDNFDSIAYSSYVNGRPGIAADYPISKSEGTSSLEYTYVNGNCAKITQTNGTDPTIYEVDSTTYSNYPNFSFSNVFGDIIAGDFEANSNPNFSSLDYDKNLPIKVTEYYSANSPTTINFIEEYSYTVSSSGQITQITQTVISPPSPNYKTIITIEY